MGVSLISVIVCLTAFFIVFFSEFVFLREDDLDYVWNHLGTRTPYRFKYNKGDDKVTFEGCEAVKIWGLLRHGTRYPSKNEINRMKTLLPELAKKINENHKNGKGNLTEEQLGFLSRWSTKLNEKDEKLLTKEGEEEMVLLAERIRRRFPAAFSDTYDNETNYFRHSATDRAKQSAKYFTIGLFDFGDANKVWYAPAKNTENVLRFYKHCDKWQKQVKNNETTYSQQNIYGTSHEMSKSLQRISARLGFDDTLTVDDAVIIYRTCGYETAWTKSHLSPWCYALDPTDAEVLEYYEDLKHYWQDGYGYELTYKQGCMPVKDMFDTFSEKNSPLSTFLFTHSGTLLKTLSHLGLYKPTSHLTAEKRHTDRTWKLTEIDCFASNLMFVLYSCQDGDRVLSLHQERPITLPPCEDPLCSLDLLRSHYGDSINNCDLNEMCTIS